MRRPDPRRRPRLINPYRLDGPPPAPAIDRELAQEYVRRDVPLMYSARAAAILVIMIAWTVHTPWIMALGAILIVIDLVRGQLLRRFAAGLEQGRDVAQMARRRTALHFVLGAAWACLSWPAVFYSDALTGMSLLVVMGVVAGVILATSTCFVPRLFTTTYVGYSAALIPSFFVVGGKAAAVMLLALPIYQFLVWDLARSIRARLIDLLEMQFERDEAIATQAKVIEALDDSRRQAALLAATDSVTQLPNRQSLIEHLDDLVEGDSPFTLVLLDLDYFKNVNDTMGHHVGDALLIEVADALRTLVPARTMLARLGGDELAVVLPGDVDAVAVETGYQRWLKRFGKLSVAGVGTLAISATAGSARFPRDGRDRRGLLNAADMALRTAKSTCRGTHARFAPELTAVFNRETLIANLLERTIEDRLVDIHLQPQVRMSDGVIVAAEALTRFRCPELAVFPVQLAFDVAEERGLGRRLARLLLAETRVTIDRLIAQVPSPVPVAINLSQSTLKAPQVLLTQLRGWLADGLSAELVKLEITEDAVSGRGLGHLLHTLATISGLGFTLSLDDFGTGQASLAHLHSLPIGELKIAKQFVDGVPTDRKNQAIVRSALAMCDHLGIDCVVEGVETAEQERVLTHLGARIAQGHRWASALPYDSFVRALTADRNRCAAPVVQG